MPLLLKEDPAASDEAFVRTITLERALIEGPLQESEDLVQGVSERAPKIPWSDRRSPAWLAGFVFFGLVAQCGLWVVPGNFAFQRMMAMNLHVNPKPGSRAEYLLTSILVPGIAHVLGLGSSFLGVARLASLLGIVGTGAIIVRWLEPRIARAVLLTVAATPVAGVAVMWIGMTDAIVIMLITGLLLTPRAWKGFLFALLAGLAHREQAMVAVVAWVVLVSLVHPNEDRKAGLRRVGFGIVGYLSAYGVVELYLSQLRPHRSNSRSSYIGLIGGNALANNALRNLQVVLLSGFGVGIIVIAAVFGGLHVTRRFACLRIVSVFVGAIAVGCFTPDVTRVIGILSWQAIITTVVVGMRTEGLRELVKKRARQAAILGFVLPRLVLWEGVIHTTAMPWFVSAMIDGLTGSNIVGSEQKGPFSPSADGDLRITGSGSAQDRTCQPAVFRCHFDPVWPPPVTIKPSK